MPGHFLYSWQWVGYDSFLKIQNYKRVIASIFIIAAYKKGIGIFQPIP